jgi:hypothetical protein
MKTQNKVLMAGALAVLLSFNASALSITGGISLSGGPITTDTGNLNAAHAITSFGTVTTTAGATGSYATVAGSTSVGTTTGFTFLPSLVGAPIVNVWSFVSGGNTYSFDLASIASVTQGFDVLGNQFLDISGSGTLHITGMSDAAGVYIFTANSAGGTFSFSSSNGAVPDGGTTIIFLGAAMSGLAWVNSRRKK